MEEPNARPGIPLPPSPTPPTHTLRVYSIWLSLYLPLCAKVVCVCVCVCVCRTNRVRNEDHFVFFLRRLFLTDTAGLCVAV